MIADLIDTVLAKKDDATIARVVKTSVRALADRFPLYVAPRAPAAQAAASHV